MRRLSAWIIIMTGLFVLSTLAARTVGAAGRADSDWLAKALRTDIQVIDGTGCWREICPGQTLLDDAAQQLEQWTDLKAVMRGADRRTVNFHLESTTPPRWTVLLLRLTETPQVTEIQIHTEMNMLSIGHMLNLLGTPVTRRVTLEYGLWTTVICFPHRICAGIIDSVAGVEPRSQVDFIDFPSLLVIPGERYSRMTRAWRGFVSPLPRP